MAAGDTHAEGSGVHSQKVRLESDNTGTKAVSLANDLTRELGTVRNSLNLDGTPLDLLFDQAFQAGSIYQYQARHTGIDTGDEYNWRLKTPSSGTDVYISVDYDDYNDVEWRIYENPTVTGAGSAGSLLAINRENAVAAETLIYAGTTTSSDGQVIYSDFNAIYNAWVASRFAIATGINRVWKLKRNEDYMIQAKGAEDSCEAAIELLIIEVQ